VLPNRTSVLQVCCVSGIPEAGLLLGVDPVLPADAGITNCRPFGDGG
jgi:hypothetical protein